MSLESLLLTAGIGGLGVYAAALALGIRHGIDWDHIAAITDITSTAAAVDNEGESWLIGEPGVMLTDESHHSTHSHTHEHEDDGPQLVVNGVAARPGAGGAATATLTRPLAGVRVLTASLPRSQKHALWLGSLYAIGHGAVVVALGIVAILAAEFLPSWIDPIMEKLVGVTLLFLAAYLFYSVYRYYRGGSQFHMRSRWMLVFAGVRNAWHWARSHIGQHEHVHVEPQSYSSRTALGIGVIHGIGAETGTQALIIATAVGATSQSVAIGALFVFVIGLLISNTAVTVMSTVGFVSAHRRQTIYVMAGIVAAVFSLVLGIVFLTASTGILPELDPYFRWIGGPT
jgi:high-affinity nickel-transport protein